MGTSSAPAAGLLSATVGAVRSGGAVVKLQLVPASGLPAVSTIVFASAAV